MQHSDIIGGSSALRRIQCTGSAALEASITPPEASDAARMGTALHDLMYRALDDPENNVPKRGVAVDWRDDEGRVHIPAETIDDKFFPAYEAVCELIEAHDIATYDLEVSHKHEKTAGPEVFGTLDFVGWSGRGYVVIADFKFGSGVRVHARENYQLAFYAVGLWEAEPDAWTGDKIVFAIIQPWHDGTCIDEWETTTWWLESYRQLERQAYLRIKNNKTALKAGGWCQFCRAAAICPEQQASLTTFANLPPELPGEMDGARLAVLLEQGERAVAMNNALVAFATEAAEKQGVKIPGFKIIESLGNRAFRDADTAERLAVDLFGSEAHTKKLKTPAQLEKVAKRMKVDFHPLADMIHRPSRGGRLVPDTHKAPEILSAATPVKLPDNVVSLQRKKNSK